jgi:hypothetical protein
MKTIKTSLVLSVLSFTLLLSSELSHAFDETVMPTEGGRPSQFNLILQNPKFSRTDSYVSGSHIERRPGEPQSFLVNGFTPGYFDLITKIIRDSDQIQLHTAAGLVVTLDLLFEKDATNLYESYREKLLSGKPYALNMETCDKVAETMRTHQSGILTDNRRGAAWTCGITDGPIYLDKDIKPDSRFYKNIRVLFKD